MDVIKTFKVNMNMGYGEYLKSLNGAPFDYTVILDRYAKELTDGPLEEIIKFFNLEEEDRVGLTKNNFAIGYKVLKDDREKCILNLNIRIDIRVPDPREENAKPKFDMASMMGMMAGGMSGDVVDGEGEVVTDDKTPAEESIENKDTSTDNPVEE